jgi:hypothetical protein
MDCLGIQVDKCTRRHYTENCIHKEMDCMGLLLVGVRLNKEHEKGLKYKNKTKHILVEQYANNSISL